MQDTNVYPMVAINAMIEASQLRSSVKQPMELVLAKKVGGLQPKRISTFAVYNLTETDGRVVSTNRPDFDQDEYSRFKHGDEFIAQKYGYQTADCLLSDHSSLFDVTRSDSVLIAPFPFKHVKTAAACMVSHTIDRLNLNLTTRFRPSVGFLHPFKFPFDPAIEHHFAGMQTEAERLDLLKKVRLTIDATRLINTHLVVIDDVFITGSSMKNFLGMLGQIQGILSLTVVFLGHMDQEVVAKGAGIEKRLNHSYVKDLNHILDIIKSGKFRWNIRVVKFIFEGLDGKGYSPEVFEAFLKEIPDYYFMKLMLTFGANDYHLEERYKPFFHLMCAELVRRGLN